MTNKSKRQLKHPAYTKFQGFLKENRIGLKQVASVLNSTVPTVSAKNNGWADFTMSEINIICDEFGCSSELFRVSKCS